VRRDSRWSARCGCRASSTRLEGAALRPGLGAGARAVGHSAARSCSMANRYCRNRRPPRARHSHGPVRRGGAVSSIEPRRALLDTSVLLDFSAMQVAEFADEIAVSSISIAELQYE